MLSDAFFLIAELAKNSAAGFSARKSQNARDFVCTWQNTQFLNLDQTFINQFPSHFFPNYVEKCEKYIWIFSLADEPAT